MMTVAGWPLGTVDPDAAHRGDAHATGRQLEPFTRGFYVNDMAREATAKDINANYRGNYQRLVALKTKYDPTNLFRLNANVAPARACEPRKNRGRTAGRSLARPSRPAFRPGRSSCCARQPPICADNAPRYPK